ncbi:hypothetical protein NARC_30113 [Candidatus Nitrosocosmicus arcticus]|uniref:Uncharacterized protein n=1 Tax=Candidatus Nitrosocosmicus arcticus TaxID=2035267 RepID=A0A557SXR2_9ARCH|nr:hypothetical protein NARC_30113 [Candidatus Nitrosocosmicus arcticus]
MRKNPNYFTYDITHCPDCGVEVEEQDHENRDRYWYTHK